MAMSSKRSRPKMTVTGVSDPPKPTAKQGTEASVPSVEPEISGSLHAPRKPGPSEEKPRQQSRIGKRAVTFYVSPEAFRQLGVMSAQTDRSIQDLMQEALDWQFQQHDMHRIARE